MNLDFDLHIHTFHSPCGKLEMLLPDIIHTAVQRGITQLGITDHFYPSTDPDIFDDIRSAAADACSKMENPPEIFFGCEAEVMSPGSTTATPELAAQLDFVMAAATHFQNKGITDLPADRSDRSIADHFLKMFEYAVSLPWVDTIAHPFFVVPGICPVEVLYLLQDSDLLPAIELAKENNIAMEISRRVFFPGQLEFSVRFYELCKKVGLKFSIGSDAHALVDVGNMQILRPVINTLGLTEKDFWLP